MTRKHWVVLAIVAAASGPIAGVGMALWQVHPIAVAAQREAEEARRKLTADAPLVVLRADSVLRRRSHNGHTHPEWRTRAAWQFEAGGRVYVDSTEGVPLSWPVTADKIHVCYDPRNPANHELEYSFLECSRAEARPRTGGPGESR